MLSKLLLESICWGATSPTMYTSDQCECRQLNRWRTNLQNRSSRYCTLRCIASCDKKKTRTAETGKSPIYFSIQTKWLLLKLSKILQEAVIHRCHQKISMKKQRTWPKKLKRKQMRVSKVVISCTIIRSNVSADVSRWMTYTYIHKVHSVGQAGLPLSPYQCAN